MSKKQACQAPKKAIDVEVTFFPGLTLTGKFGTYVIEGFISSGSFSKVFTGYHQDTKEKYALKFMNYLMDGMTESSLLLAVNELDPRYRNYLCKICDVVTMENARNIGLVVERGACSLLDVMNANDLHPLHIRHVKTIMHQLFCALEGLHSIHILHADVKPENILLRRTTKIFRGRLPDNRLAIELMDLHIMLCDFNCSKYVPHWVRKPDDTIQTFHYRAPEIVLNTETTEIIDIFSAGAMLAELASGYIVFDMESKNILAPGLEERAKHLRLMEREIGQCPKEVYQKSPDKYFSSGEWIKCSALAPSHSWFKDWREEISIAGTDEENDLLEVIDHTMTWPERRANAQEAVTLRFFGHFHCDTPRDTFYENMKPISADDLLSMKCDEHENGAELLRKEPELINCSKTIKIEEDVQSPPVIRESPKRYKTRSSVLGKPTRRWPAKSPESVNTHQKKKRRTK